MINRYLMSGKGFIAFMLGSIIFGSFFSTIIFYNLPEFWEPAKVWNIRYSLMAACLLSLPLLLSYYLEMNTRALAFWVLLIASGFLVVWLEDKHAVSVISGGGLQLILSWSYRLFIIIPIVLSVCAHFVCGMFFLSWARFISEPKNKDTPSLNVMRVFTTFGVVLLLSFTAYCMITIKGGSVFASVSLAPSNSTELRSHAIRELKRSVSYRDEINETNIYVGNSDTDSERVQSVLKNILLLKLTPKEFWQRGKRRNVIIKYLRDYLGTIPNIEAQVFDNPVQPQVPLKPVYTFQEMKYNLDQKSRSRLLELGVDIKAWNDAVSTKIRLSNDMTPQSLGDTYIYIADGTGIPLKYFGSFELTNTEFKTEEWSKPHWAPMSSIKEKSGIIIHLSEKYLNARGLNLVDVEANILNYLKAQTSAPDVSLIYEYVVIETSDGEKVRLKDVAEVRQGYIRRSSSEINGELYEIIE